MLLAKITQEDEQPWQQQPGENNLWYSRFCQYLALGPTRSMREVYRLEKGNEQSKSPGKAWANAAQRFSWQYRATAYDAHLRKMIFTQGNASDMERVKKLDALIEKLYTRAMTLLEKAPAEEEFSDELVTALLRAVDIMAKHTGGYSPKRVEHTGKDGKPIEVQEEQRMRVVFYVPEVEPILDDRTIITPIDESLTSESA